MTMRDKLSQYGKMADAKLSEILKDAALPDVLRDSMSYSIFAGGKRLRPALCMAACELSGGSAEDAILPASAIEMIHAYSLIHDDLPALDNDDLRRGRPSNHIAFGEANAIIAGDGLQSLAFVTAAKTENVHVVAAIAKGAMDMVAGQSYDLTAGNDESLLYTIHRLKTGALILASVLSGAYCANVDSQTITALNAFAEHYGMLFQITDDILDTEGTSDELGKSVGKDADENKVTFVTVFGLDGAKQKAREAAISAKEALLAFSDRAWFFRELVDSTLTRRN